MNASEVRQRLQGLAKHVQSVVGKDTAFVLMVFADDEEGGGQRTEYVSNGARGEIRKAIAEWLQKTGEADHEFHVGRYGGKS